MANESSPVDEGQILKQAAALIPASRATTGPAIVRAVAGGPRRVACDRLSSRAKNFVASCWAEPPRPLMFISTREHTDKLIAEAIAEFIKRTTANQVVVFDSSSSRRKPPNGQERRHRVQGSAGESDVVSWCSPPPAITGSTGCRSAGSPETPATNIPRVSSYRKHEAGRAPKPFTTHSVVDAATKTHSSRFIKQSDGPMFSHAQQAVEQL